MEKRLNKFKNVTSPLFISVICIFSSVIIYDAGGWWIPILGGSISIIGWNFRIRSQIDLGFLLTGGTFFYALRDIDFNFTNLFFILAAFFLLLSGRYLLRRSSLLIYLKKEGLKGSGEKHLQEFKRDSMVYFLETSLSAFLLALLGGMISYYSFLGPFPSRYGIPIVIGLSVLFMVGLYVVTILLPRKYAASRS